MLKGERDNHRERIGGLQDYLNRLNEQNAELIRQSNTAHENATSWQDLYQKAVKTYQELENGLREQIKTAEGDRDVLAQENRMLKREKGNTISLEQHRQLLRLYSDLLRESQLDPDNRYANDFQVDTPLCDSSTVQTSQTLVLRPSTDLATSPNLEFIRPATPNRFISGRQTSGSSNEFSFFQSYVPIGTPQQVNKSQNLGNSRSMTHNPGASRSVTPQDFELSRPLSPHGSIQSGRSMSPQPFGQPPDSESSFQFETSNESLEQPFSFLIAGDVETGSCTMNVHPQIIQMMNQYLNRWRKKVDWNTVKAITRQRCVETRHRKINLSLNPPNGQTPNEACQNCTRKSLPCVLIGENGPVVVPIPARDRIGMTSKDAGFYIKQKP